MFPFQFGNSFGNNNFPYNMNYQLFRPSYPEIGNYAYPCNYQNFGLSSQNILPNSYIPQQRNYITGLNSHEVKQQSNTFQKRKRLTKRIVLTDTRKEMREHSKQYKLKRKSFKYFDPSRAPPITSLRNKLELELDLNDQDKIVEEFKKPSQMHTKENDRDYLKLKLLLKQPNERQYPFLICKKRKYYRNLKRRYSVAYFQQRASFINNKLPIPSQLHPKNKIRKSRISNKNTTDAVIQDSYQYDEEQVSDSQQYSFEEVNQEQKREEKFQILKKQQKFHKKTQNIKQEIQSQSVQNFRS